MIVKFNELPQLRNKFNNKKIVLTGGTFDLIHSGHINFFKNLRQFGDIIVIALSTDKRVRQRKGQQRPILHQKERLILVDSIRYVDFTLIAPSPFSKKEVPTMRIIKSLKPDIFVTADKRWLKFKNDFNGLFTLKIIPREKTNSTTRIIKRILKVHSV